jgi:hypothetical protein
MNHRCRWEMTLALATFAEHLDFLLGIVQMGEKYIYEGTVNV